MNKQEYKYYFGANAEEDFAESDLLDPKSDEPKLDEDEDEDEDDDDDEVDEDDEE